MADSDPRPETIEMLANSVYPAFAMLAGIQLDLFTPLKDGPLNADQIAEALGVGPDKLNRLLYALLAAKLLVVDPRPPSSPQWAALWLGLDVGADIALANAMAREILVSGLENRGFIERATSGFEEYRACVERYTLEYAAQVCRVPAAQIREAAHAYAKAGRAQICWTLGITEHHNAVDNVLALINLALLTGHVGRYGSGFQSGGVSRRLPSAVSSMPGSSSSTRSQS